MWEYGPLQCKGLEAVMAGRDRPPEIVVTPAMIDAGLEEFRSYHYDSDSRLMLESVFRAMAYASVSASVTIPSK